MAIIDEAKALLGHDVRATHWTGTEIEGKLIGVCEQPTLIFETAPGQRFTYAVRAISDLSAAPADGEGA